MKPKLILLHGALGDAKQLQPLRAHLESEFEVFVPDLPGHGNSAVVLTEYTIENLSSFLHHYMQSMSEKVYVFGYSMGGYVALYTAIQFPELFNGVVTLATKFDWNPESVAKEIALLNPDRMLEKVPAYAKILTERHENHDWKKVLQGTAHLMERLALRPLLPPASFKNLSLPVWLGLGDRDTMVNAEETRRIQQAISGASFYILPETTHPIEKVDADCMAFLIRKFVANFKRVSRE